MGRLVPAYIWSGEVELEDKRLGDSRLQLVDIIW